MNVSVHIERLILEGVPLEYAQRPVLQAAVEAELVRRFTEDGIAPGLLSGGARAYTRGDAIHLANGDTPAQWGHQIGRAVYGGMGR